MFQPDTQDLSGYITTVCQLNPWDDPQGVKGISDEYIWGAFQKCIGALKSKSYWIFNIV